MKIKEGEYVRTKDGRIEKIKETNKYGIVIKHKDTNDTFSEGINWYAESGREINKEDIIKHSKNIIDLIEVGDFVNGHRVIDIAEAPVRAIYTEDISQELALIPITEERIKSIVTKEQYEEIEYKI
jgi:hypothetical protein